MTTAADILGKLHALANAEDVDGMSRFGIAAEGRLGVSVPDMRRIAKEAGKDHAAALELWSTGIAEARIVASMIAVPDELTDTQMESWVADFNSWDVCDQVCMNLFEKTPLARAKIVEWSSRDEEFVRRAAFALIACLGWHDKKAPDAEFVGYLPLIERGATDERNFVKKAVNWALRNIGKRNPALNTAAIETAERIQTLDSKPARWIASDALRELKSEVVRARLDIR